MNPKESLHMEIHSIRLGPLTNCFLIKGDHGAILIDAGFPRNERRFFRSLNRLGIRPGDVRLIIVTHGHADHVGSLRAIKEQTGALVAIHQADSYLAQTGTVVVPPPITRWGGALFVILSFFSFLGRFRPVQPEIILEDRFAIDRFGVSGCVIWTPGHTRGSVSLVLKGGEAFVGDLAVNVFPLEVGLGVPAVGESREGIFKSWGKLISAGATRIYPAHGKPFSADRLKEKAHCWSRTRI